VWGVNQEFKKGCLGYTIVITTGETSRCALKTLTLEAGKAESKAMQFGPRSDGGIALATSFRGAYCLYGFAAIVTGEGEIR